MISRILSRPLPFLIYQPPGVCDPVYLRACHAAGAMPIVDAEFLDDARIKEHVEALEKEEIVYGVRLSARRTELLEYLNRSTPNNLELVIFHYETPEDLSRIALQGADYKIFIEVYDIGITQAIEGIDPHALILKGNEAPGRVSHHTSFILMQWYLKNTTFPVFIHGGVGLHTAAGMFAAGASGVVLDDQLYLAEEAPLANAYKQMLAKLEENDTTLIGCPLGRHYRVFAKLGTKAVKDLKERESFLTGKPDGIEALYQDIRERRAALDQDNPNPVQALFYLGQDANFARIFAGSSNTLQDMITRFCDSIQTHLEAVETHDPMVRDSKLAREHGTAYPVMQGPMANISDSPAFAKAVFEAGGLPFFAMGSLPPELADRMLAEGKKEVPRFGAGMIGIAALNPVLNHHFDSMKTYRPPFALLAGGNPSQIMALEGQGTHAYLHTPSMMLLDNCIAAGCRRFIFEGAEAGGHVGSLTSMVLWELAVERILQQPDQEISTYRIVFAGGLATNAGSCFISGLSAALAKKGAGIAIQVGTAYLFSKEIVESGALKPNYQQTVLCNDRTVVIGRTMGLSSRTVPTPFAERMVEKEHHLVREKRPLEERKKAFETENFGSLLIAAKGFLPDFKGKKGDRILFNEEEQTCRGNFLCGDALACETETTTIAAIHSRYFECKAMLRQRLNALSMFIRPERQVRDEIAIIGMGCVYPDAFNTEAFWENIRNRTYSIREMPAERLNPDLYVDADRAAEDRAYSRIGGIIEGFVFDHAKFGMTADEARLISRSQQIILEAAWQAVTDAGCLNGDAKEKNPGVFDRTAVIIGSCLGNELTNDIQLKYYYPEICHHLEQIDEFQALDEGLRKQVIENLQNGLAKGMVNEQPAGATLNIEASRLAAFLGAKGVNYVVDAACATSFAAVDCAVRELLDGSHDMVVVGGVNTLLSPEAFVGFCKMGALSALGSFPFDGRADGFVLGEGAGVVVLKRMKDALADGDRIHGVIKGIGSSSDGRGKAIAAPNPDGQAIALKRCFEMSPAGVGFDDVDFIEAHGTSTQIGDQAEIKTIANIYKTTRPVGISSIKSQIGHLLGGAGMAGLIKTLLSMKHRTLPANGRFESLAAHHNLDGTNLYIIKDNKPWETVEGKPRRAAVSSFGFGGINYHVALEEFTDAYRPLNPDYRFDPMHDADGDRIVAAGIGVVLPGAGDADAFWQNMVTGKNCLAPIPEERFHNSAYAAETDAQYHIPHVKAGIVANYAFDNRKYRIPPLTAKTLDRAQCFALDATDQAVRASGLKDQLTPGNRVGVIIGTLSGEKYAENVLRTRLPVVAGILETSLASAQGVSREKAAAVCGALMERLKNRYFKNTEDTLPGLLSNIVSGRIANCFGCNGANFVIDSACASAAFAMDQSIKGLRAGTFESVITGGVDAGLYPAIILAFKRLGLLSEGQSRFFDREAAGVNLGEGAAVLVLTTLRHARKHNMPVLGEIKTAAFQSRAQGNMFSPSEQMFTSVMQACQGRGETRSDQIRHMDVFGFTSTLFDRIEHQALNNGFKHPVRFGNIKTEIGYFKAANPAIVMARLMLMASKRTLLPHHSFLEGTTLLTKDSKIVPGREPLAIPRGRNIHLAMNVFGFGGNHGHMVVGTLPRHLEKRAASVDQAQPAVVKAIRTVKRSADAATVAGPLKTGVVALLSGQGAQYGGMMKELYRENKTIRSLMDEAERIFIAMRGYSLLEIMFADNDARLNLTENTQPAVFLSTAALYRVLADQGFAPDAFIGHSVGEYTALYCNGMLPFDGALRLIIQRSDFMKQATEAVPGNIMVVFDNAVEAERLIKESGIGDLYIANKNSPKQTGVSGRTTSIDAFCEWLTQAKVRFKKLALSGAFHTPLFDPAARKMEEVLAGIRFSPADYSKIVANLTARPYPSDEAQVKQILRGQIVSPVEFIESITHVFERGAKYFIEIGPGKILTNLLQSIEIGPHASEFTLDAKKGEAVSLERMLTYLKEEKLITAKRETSAPVKPAVAVPAAIPDMGNVAVPKLAEAEMAEEDDEFKRFVADHQENLKRIMHREYLKHKRAKSVADYERFRFYTGPVAIAGVAIGLPGSGNKVFDSDNFDKILSGTNLIEPLTREEKERMLDMRITRVFKESDGNARFKDITSIADVIQLAGKLGYFNLQKEYGIEHDYDITFSLAIAAGLEALKDAGIPLVRQYKQTSTGAKIPEGWFLPKDMQDTTGVIFTSVFPGYETLIRELTNYYYSKFYVRPYEELENIYYHLMENVKDKEIKGKITEWFYKILERRKEYGDYHFDRNILLDIVPLGSAHFAQLIKARGPNIQMNGACASTTQAVGVAEDWIRRNRCERVIIIGGEASTSEAQSQWVGSGFLALGAATVKSVVAEAAKPFDSERNGTILGSGAVSLIVERLDRIHRRGLYGQAEVLGTYLGNSAFHATRINVDHMTSEMKKFVDEVEFRNNLTKKDYANELIFMSHETFTPAQGGSASAEVAALKQAFPDHYRNITITNTKGFTGHTLGAAIEDAVLVKALQRGVVPPIANLKHIPKEFADLNLKGLHKGDYQYGLHYSAGFGSHFSFLFLRRIEGKGIRHNSVYRNWLKTISGNPVPRLTIINNTLCLESEFFEEARKTPDLRIATPEKNSGAALAKVQPPRLKERIKKIVAEQTGYTVDMLEDDLDLEADLGIDTVKQVEVFGKVADEFNLKVPEDLKLRDLSSIALLAAYIERETGGTVHAASSAPRPTGAGSADIKMKVKQIVAEQTGYTVDMLEDDLDLEADLGIDTVKQVEVFGKVADEFNLKVPEDLKLRDLSSIALLAAYIERETGGTVHAVSLAMQPTGAGRADIKMKVKQIVAEQTGYTVDMLEDDLDLEADLGIDTVKQVEVFGKVADEFNLKVPEDLKLRDLSSIALLAAYIEKETGLANPMSSDKGAGHEHAPVMQSHEAEAKGGKTIRRREIRLMETAIPDVPGNPFEGRTFLITQDGHGFADRIASIIQQRGGRTITLGADSACDYQADFDRPESMEGVMDAVITAHPDISGLIHAQPLNGYVAAIEKKESDQRSIQDVKSFFIIVKKLAGMLKNKGALLSAPTFHSVVFPHAAHSDAGRIHPCFAGIAGIMKSVGREFNDAIVKIVDFADGAPLQHMDALVAQYMNEVANADTAMESGYDQGKRYVPELFEGEYRKAESMVREGDTLLVTGGGQGITFEILKALCPRKSLRLIIFGRSNIFADDEPLLKSDFDKAAIIERLNKRLTGAKPLEIKAAAERVIRTRQTLNNIETLKSLGAHVDYHAVDVTDGEAVRSALANYKTIDGVIHAAGVEDSQLLEKKTMQSFNRVFDTKVIGLRNLLEAVDGMICRYFIVFSSVAARFGNQGQTDYAAANEMMARTLQREISGKPDRTFKIIDWTAWEGTGMAENPSVKTVLTRMGVEFLPIRRGVEIFMDEIHDPRSTEIVVGGSDSGLGAGTAKTETEKAAAQGPVAPFLDACIHQDKYLIAFRRVLDPAQDRFLLDHSREGVPIFLGATGLEALLEAAYEKTGRKGRPREMRNFSIPYGIKILKGRPKEIRIEAYQDNPDKPVCDCRITSVFSNARMLKSGSPTLHYQGTVLVSETNPDPVVVELPEFSPLTHKEEFDELIYHPGRLFMGGLFKSIQSIRSFDGETLVIALKTPVDAGAFFNGRPHQEMLTDVTLVDGMFQGGGLFGMLTTDDLALPFRVRRMSFFEPAPVGMEMLCLIRKTASTAETHTYQLALVDSCGQAYIRMEDFEMVRLGAMPKEIRISHKFTRESVRV